MFQLPYCAVVTLAPPPRRNHNNTYNRSFRYPISESETRPQPRVARGDVGPAILCLLLVHISLTTDIPSARNHEVHQQRSRPLHC